MKYILICALFSPMVYLAFRQKKWYLFLLFGLMGVLPEQFSIEIHEVLPMVSATRILIVVAMSFWAYDKWKTRKFTWPVSLLIFLGVNILISIINLRFGADEFNRMFRFVFERVVFAIVVMDLITSKEEFEKCIDFMIMGSVILAVIGISQTVYNYDIASVLHLSETLSSIMLTDRMGLIRAYGTYNAISYGCYCAFMMLLIYYKMENSSNKFYTLAMALNFVAMICTLSRSAWLCILGTAFLIFLTRPARVIRKVWVSLVLVIVITVGLAFAQPKLSDALLETSKSTINTVLRVLPEDWLQPEKPTEPTITTPTQTEPAPTQTEPAPTQTDPTENKEPGFELSDEFGYNGDRAAQSRLFQWSVVRYMMMDGNLLFGYGYNALPEGKIHYDVSPNADLGWWSQMNTVDVGLVGVIVESGIVGLLATLCLFAYIFIQSLRKWKRGLVFDFYKMAVFMVPLLLLLNFMASFMHDHVVWMFIALYYAYEHLEEN